ncbi:MAG: DUF47 family protein [Promethearchaeota archaeon]
MSGKENIFSTEFKGMLDTIDKSGFLLVDLLEKSCKPNFLNNIGPVIDDIIMHEKIVDRTKDLLIEHLYVSMKYSSKFTNEDNLFVIRRLDQVEDAIEAVARYFYVYSFEIPPPINENIITLVKKVNEVIQFIVSCVELFYASPSSLRDEKKRLEDARRESRELELGILAELFQHMALQLDTARLIMIKSLVENLTRIANIAEEFGDDIEAIALKYMYEQYAMNK